jgi:hypothetical protein
MYVRIYINIYILTFVLHIYLGSNTDTGATVSYTKKGDKMNEKQISSICKKFLQSSGDYIRRVISVAFYYLCGYFSFLMSYWLFDVSLIEDRFS